MGFTAILGTQPAQVGRLVPGYASPVVETLVWQGPFAAQIVIGGSMVQVAPGQQVVMPASQVLQAAAGDPYWWKRIA